MIDFHSHILPGVDDGPDNIETSVKMLISSKDQGVDTIFATPHFYAEKMYPDMFLKKRNDAFEYLKLFLDHFKDRVPEVRLGSEVYYYPGMSDTDELKSMTFQDTDILMIEPPMRPWTDYILDEIAETGKNNSLRICCAHVDRYMRVFDDYSLIDRLKEREILIQFNTKAFTDENFRRTGLSCLLDGYIDMIGTDAHDMEKRVPNMYDAVSSIYKAGLQSEFTMFIKHSRSLLNCK